MTDDQKPERRVQVLSNRPDMNGRYVYGKTGTAIVVPGDDEVYIEGDGWYGSWPKDETNLEEVIKREKEQEEASKQAAKVKTVAAPEGDAGQVTSYLVDERDQIIEGISEIEFLKQFAGSRRE